MGFADNLKQFLRNAKISQHRLAEMTGICEVSICRYVKGEREPGCENIRTIANALGVSADYLLNGDIKPIRARIGDVVIDRTYNHKGYLGIVVGELGYQPILLSHKIGLQMNRLGESYGSWGNLEIIGHIDFEAVWQKALEIENLSKGEENEKR